MPPSTRQCFVIPWKVGEGWWMSFSGANRFKGISDVKRGYKTYELSNHLGNVLATVSDRLVSGTCTDSIVDFYDADILTISDYYPFGMTMEGRTQYAEKYRFGFNGMEKYDHWQGEGHAYDFGARVYDSRLGRWMSVDPLAGKYEDVSPYIFSINSPLAYKDIDGRDIIFTVQVDANGNKTLIVTVNAQLLNLSSQHRHSSDLVGLKSQIEGQARRTFSGAFTDGTTRVDVKFNINIEIINSMDQIREGAHIIALVDDVLPSPSKPAMDPIGLALRSRNASINQVKGQAPSKLIHTIIHELGHNLGLEDEYKTDNDGNITRTGGDNLMAIGSSYKLTKEQREVMFFGMSRIGEPGKTHKWANRDIGPNSGKADTKGQLKDLLSNAETQK